MHYRFAPPGSYEDFASGLVLRSAPRYPGFPVRLASELFQRARLHLGRTRDLVLWDPCCGSGQLIACLSLLHRESLARVIASDIDEGAVHLAGHNIALADPGRLSQRRAALHELAERFGKPSHARAVEAADRLASLPGGAPELTCGVADVLDPAALAGLLGDATPDIVVTDLPYGEQTGWHGGVSDELPPAESALRALQATIAPDGVAVLVNRGRRPEALSRPREQLRVGRRVAAFYTAGRGGDQ